MGTIYSLKNKNKINMKSLQIFVYKQGTKNKALSMKIKKQSQMRVVTCSSIKNNP
jgi:hypothetical protein